MNWVNAVIQGILLGGQYALIACGLSLTFRSEERRVGKECW